MSKRRATSEGHDTETQPIAQADLPEGWTRAPLSDLTEDVPNVKPEAAPSKKYRYIDIGGVDNKSNRVTAIKEFLGEDAPSRARRPIQIDDVLFSNVRTYLRNIVMVTPDMPADLCSTGFTVLRSNDAVDPRFLFYSVLNADFIEEVSETQTGTQYPATSDRQVRATHILLPPLAEQRRISDRIEILLKDVEAARERLARVIEDRKEGDREIPSILRRFRQAVLAAACSGRLTEEWRATHSVQSSVEAAIGLVLKARQDSLQAKRRRTHPRFLMPDTPELDPLPDMPDIPVDWVISSVGFAAHRIQYGTSTKSDADETTGVLNLGMQNIQEGRIDLSSEKHVRSDAAGLADVLLARGDLLFNRTNSPELVGKSAVFDMDRKAVFASYLIRVKVDARLALPEFICAWINSSWGREWAQQVKSDAVSQSNINGTKLGEMPLPLPSLNEQKEIVRLISAYLGSRERAENRIRTAGIQADKLAQAISAKAFRGELVPTEAELARAAGASFETGEQLLARVTALAAAQPKKPRGRRLTTRASQKSRRIDVRRLDEVTATHLHDILKSSKSGMAPEKLLDAAELEVDDFYTQLKREVEAGKVKERRKGKATILLEAAS